MADFNDMVVAIRETDIALENLQSGAGKAEDAGAYAALVTGLGLEAVALAIREASIRADYVQRDIYRRERE
jgi:hypothetical protein